MSQTAPTGLILSEQLHTRIFFWFISPISVDYRCSFKAEIDFLHITVYNKWRENLLCKEDRSSVLLMNFTRKL